MSLDLDSRQRAMLQEMGLRVWWPETVAAPPLAAAESAVVQPLNTSPADLTPVPSPSRGPVVVAAPADVLALPDGIAGMDWTALAQSVAQCQACKLCLGRRGAVFGAVPRQADWLVVGEPPDDSEERLGSPFAGQAGQLLDNMLKAVGVSRSGVVGDATDRASAAYVTNVVKCRPSPPRNPQPQELAACENYLRRELALVQPKVILALGRFAAQTLLQGSVPGVAGIPLGKLRGQIHRYQGIPVVVSYHPAYLLRTPQDKARAWADLCLALAAVKSAGL
ncbi:MAG: uracil-DNA glycosylase [Rhodoferax sp.]|uniref:uracil-DNA glycosylase n=1 Tax=Rhodoferax sp. TaxID=50421 RepID=UPI00260A18D4|nr:uracil-DNA glycosylase [Rhodoferax sp.]MDD5334268.1 uracil-DNA glycosylase [Rhodoferax sp.]